MRTASTTPFFRGFPRLPGQSVFDHEKQQIAAVSRVGNLDLFVIGFDNHVWLPSGQRGPLGDPLQPVRLPPKRGRQAGLLFEGGSECALVCVPDC